MYLIHHIPKRHPAAPALITQVAAGCAKIARVHKVVHHLGAELTRIQDADSHLRPLP